MTALGVFATIIFWCGCCGMLFGAFVALVGMLTDDEDAGAATREDRGGWAVPSSGRAKQSHIAHDEDDQ